MSIYHQLFGKVHADFVEKTKQINEEKKLLLLILVIFVLMQDIYQ